MVVLGPLTRLLIGSLIGLVTLWLAFRGHGLAALGQAVGQAHAAGVWLALASVGATLFVVTVRWQVLFGRGDIPAEPTPDHQHTPRPGTGAVRLVPSLRALFAALILGQATNIVLPIRIGELLRVYVASRAGSVPVSGVLATVVVERLADVAMLALGASVLAVYVALPDWVVGPTRALAVTGLIAVGAIAVIVLAGGRLSAFIQARVAASASRNRTIQRLAHHGALAVGEATNLRDWRTLSAVAALSVLSLVLSASTNYLLFRAFDMPLPFVAALFLLLVLAVGTAPVSTPGNLGVFQYLTVLALGAYGVDGTKALAYSMVLYAVALGPKLVIGAIVFGIVTKRGVLEPGIWAKLRGRE